MKTPLNVVPGLKNCDEIRITTLAGTTIGSLRAKAIATAIVHCGNS